ncbi:MAG TPA: hypothetical protein VGI74_15310 [Streptosporangiaceae bacterium]
MDEGPFAEREAILCPVSSSTGSTRPGPAEAATGSAGTELVTGRAAGN